MGKGRRRRTGRGERRRYEGKTNTVGSEKVSSGTM